MMRLVMVAVGVCLIALLFPGQIKSLLGTLSNPEATTASSQLAETPQTSGLRLNKPRPIGGTVVLQAAANGHYYSQAMINGRAVKVVVDTGATAVALPYEDARSLGLLPPPSAFTLPVMTANGEGRAARITLREIRLGSIRLGNVEAYVMPKNQLGIALLGMSFLSRLSQASIQSGELVLRP